MACGDRYCYELYLYLTTDAAVLFWQDEIYILTLLLASVLILPTIYYIHYPG